MNIQTAIRDLSSKLGPPKPRAAHGQWVPYAWLVRGLVEKGHGVSRSVNYVLENAGLTITEASFGSVRSAYYKIKDQEWPAKLAGKGDETENQFE
jgi:hypothetical protein